MQVFSINPQTQQVQTLEIQAQANTIYSFFNSILIDESLELKDHNIYTDANALESLQVPFFLGEQLLLGTALITGRLNSTDTNASIPLASLQDLISYDVNSFYTDTLKILSQTEVNLYRRFYVTQGNQKIELTIEWVLYTFNIADEKTKQYFLDALEKALKENTIQKTLEHMAQLAMNAS